MDDARRAQILAGVGYASGVVGTVAPQLTAKVFGLRSTSGELQSTVRMMSMRNVALGAVMSSVADDEAHRKRFFTIAAAMFAADTVATLVAAATGKVSPRTASMLGLATGALAALAAAGATG